MTVIGLFMNSPTVSSAAGRWRRSRCSTLCEYPNGSLCLSPDKLHQTVQGIGFIGSKTPVEELDGIRGTSYLIHRQSLFTGLTPAPQHLRRIFPVHTSSPP